MSFKKNTAVTGFGIGHFINATTGVPVTTGTPTCKRTLDGTGGACANAASYNTDGAVWEIDLANTDMNGDVVILSFTLTDCLPISYVIHTVTGVPDANGYMPADVKQVESVDASDFFGSTIPTASDNATAVMAAGAAYESSVQSAISGIASIPTDNTLGDSAHGGANATLTLKSLTISNSEGPGVNITGSDVGLLVEGSAGSGAIIRSQGGDGSGIAVNGNGTGAGVWIVGGATGIGLHAQGGSTSGDAIYALAVDGDGLHVKGGTEGHGLNADGYGGGDGIAATGGATGNGITAKGGVSSGSGLVAQAVNTGHGIQAIGDETGHGISATGGATGDGIYAGSFVVTNDVTWGSWVIGAANAYPLKLEDTGDSAVSRITDAATVDVAAIAASSAATVSAALGTGTGFTAVPWNSAWAASVQSAAGAALTAYDSNGGVAKESSITTVLARIGAWAGSGVNTILGAFKALLSKAASAPSDIGGTFTPTTDSVEALAEAIAGITVDVDEEAIAEAVAAQTDIAAFLAAWAAMAPGNVFTALALANAPTGGMPPTVDGISLEDVLQIILAASINKTDVNQSTHTVVLYARDGMTPIATLTYNPAVPGEITDSQLGSGQ